MQADILVRDSAGAAVLAVEVKARRGVDAGWAADFRRNLYAHDLKPPARFFMVVTADETYLWKEQERSSLSYHLPDAVVSTSDLIGEEGTDGRALDGQALELLTSSWLTAVTAAEDPSWLLEGSRAFLVETGLFEALRGAAVAFEVA